MGFINVSLGSASPVDYVPAIWTAEKRKKVLPTPVPARQRHKQSIAIRSYRTHAFLRVLAEEISSEVVANLAQHLAARGGRYE